MIYVKYSNRNNIKILYLKIRYDTSCKIEKVTWKDFCLKMKQKYDIIYLKIKHIY